MTTELGKVERREAEREGREGLDRVSVERGKGRKREQIEG